MNAQDYWNLFLDTGAPEAYLMYSHLAKSEDTHVLDDSGNRSAGHGLK